MQRFVIRARVRLTAAVRRLQWKSHEKSSSIGRQLLVASRVVGSRPVITKLAAIACLTGAIGSPTTANSQALPPPRDGDIRVLYWELTNRTQVWLTLELRSLDGKPLPTGMNLTFTVEFPGKRPSRPLDRIEVRANAGYMWAPKIELSFKVDGRETIDLTPPGLVSLVEGAVWNYLPVEVSIDTLGRLASAKHIDGNALGLEFELTDSQLKAIRTFYERVRSDNPGGMKDGL